MPCSNEEKKQEGTPGIAHRLARPNILELHPYRCARDDYSSGILLDANENALGPACLPTNATDNHNVLERYPDPYQIALKEKYAQYRGRGLVALSPRNIFVGVGSDEAIDLLMRIFCRPGRDNILTTPPTYGMYQVCAKVNDVQVITCPLTPEFDLRIHEVRVCVHACIPLPEYSYSYCTCATVSPYSHTCYNFFFFRCWMPRRQTPSSCLSVLPAIPRARRFL